MSVENEELKALVESAEAAVKNISDPELRKMAFGKILDSLLLSGPRGTDRRAAPRDRPRNSPAGPAVRKDAAARSGPSSHLDDLVSEGFFSKQVTLSDVRKELGNRGHHIPATSLSGPLQNLCKKKKLRRQKVIVDGRESFVYSNW